MDDLKPVTKFAFAGDNGPNTNGARDWARHIFDTAESARQFAGRWKGRIVHVEIRPLVAERILGTTDFHPYEP